MQWIIDSSWRDALLFEWQHPRYRQLEIFVDEEYSRHECYPPKERIFEAFRLCPFQDTKVVILGQDPYHEPGQAMGLSFSVPAGIPLPPSLKNIFKELQDDIHCEMPVCGDLSSWAKHGVLLLNATLTVERGKAASHTGKGWEQFTDAVISTISNQKEHVVFFLWGNWARQKKQLIDTTRHLVLESPHPSPLSAYHGFWGNHHFTQANSWLETHGLQQIDWRL